MNHDTPNDLLARAGELLDAAEADGRDLTDTEQAEYDDLVKRAERAAKLARIRELRAAGRLSVEPAQAPADPTVARRDPWSPGAGDALTRVDSAAGLATRARDAVEAATLPDHGREMLTGILDREDSDPRASAFVLAATSPAYHRAFASVMRDPQRGHLMWSPEEREAYARVEHTRAALSLTDANGGYLVPLTLDSQVVLTSSSAINPVRSVARVVTTITDTWNGTTSAGITAEWLAEGTEAADASPTFSRVTLTPEKLAAYVVGSYEVWQDSQLGSQLPALLADSFDEAEGTGFVTGAGHGSNEPEGVITAVSAVTASIVSPTTGGTFTTASVLDIYKVDNALNARARGGNPVWLANRTTLNTVRQMDTAGGSSFWADLGAAMPARLLGSEVYATTAMTATVTTGSNLILLGDFSQGYVIAQRLGTTIVPDPVVKGDNGRPTYQAGYAAFRRVTGGVMDAGRFKLLQL